MTIPVVYEVSATGHDRAGQDLAGIMERAEHAAKEAGGQLKGIARDIDVIGGKSSAEFGKMTSDLLGIAEVAVQGPIPALLALATLVGGTLVKAWEDEQKAAEEAEKAAVKAIDERKKKVEDLTEAIKKQAKAELGDEESLLAGMEARTEIIETTRGKIEALQRDFAHASTEQQKGISAQIAAQKEYIIQLENERGSMELRIDAIRRYELAQINAIEANKKDDDANAAKEKALKEQAAAREKLIELDQKASMAEFESWEDWQKIDSDKSAKMERAFQLELKYIQGTKDEEKKKADELRKLEADTAKKDDQQKARIKAYREALEKVAEAEQKHRDAIKAKNDALEQNIKSTAIASGVNTAYAVTLTAVTPAVNELGNAIGTLTMLNQDNYRELLFQGQETPRLIAAKVQAILSGIAKEATVKSLFESGETLRETALALGSIAIGDAAGASMHTASAAAHVLAANAYAALGAGSGAAAIGVGALRGGSGPIGITREEREQRERGGGTVNMQRGGDGTWRSGGDSGKTVVNITYVTQAGGILQSDEQATARTVSRGVRAARRDGFQRRQMGGAP